jgi:uncharacterized protein (DUF697 family)
MAPQKPATQHEPEDAPHVAPIEAAAATEAPAAEAKPAEMAAEAPPEVSSAPDDNTIADRRRKATRVMRRYMLFSGVAGLVPLPAVDVATVTGVQVKMLHAMTRIYGVPFNLKLARQLVLALIGGGGSVVLALPAASATKAVPVVGTAASFLLSPAFATASCYGIGRLFIGHFEAGGTLETFVPAAA